MRSLSFIPILLGTVLITVSINCPRAFSDVYNSDESDKVCAEIGSCSKTSNCLGGSKNCYNKDSALPNCLCVDTNGVSACECKR